jgi:hypothetical protein
VPRPTRKYPQLLRHDQPTGDAARAWLADELGDGLEVIPVDRVAKRVNIFRLAGPAGSGLLAESDEALADRPGVYRYRTSAWVRRIGGQASAILELELHSFDFATEALHGGDDSWLRRPKREMYAERDRRSADAAAELDTAQAIEVPPGAVPAMLAGLSPQEVRILAERHAPELL